MIDEKVLIEEFKSMLNTMVVDADGTHTVSLEAVIAFIEMFPTIQPQASINRGKWIRYEDTHEESVKYICPFCGDYTAFRGEISESTVNGNYIYCRHCGAKNGEDQ